jgi:steroid delta-isomerase-like uncharacterized protein
MILPLALIICFMVDCQDKEAMAELEAMKAQAAVEEQNIAIVKRLYEGLNKGNTEILQELCAPDYAGYSPSGSDRALSREEIIEQLKMFWRVFPDLNMDIQDMTAKGDKVIVRSINTGTHEGDFQGIAATGRKVKGSEIVIFRMQDGKVVEERAESDMLGVMMQIGMELKPKEEEK